MTSQEQELLTRVARAIYERRYPDAHNGWDGCKERAARDGYRFAKTTMRETMDDARAAIEAMMDQYPEAWLIPHACAILGDGDRAAAFAADGHEVVPLYRLFRASLSKGEE